MANQFRKIVELNPKVKKLGSIYVQNQSMLEVTFDCDAGNMTRTYLDTGNGASSLIKADRVPVLTPYRYGEQRVEIEFTTPQNVTASVHSNDIEVEPWSTPKILNFKAYRVDTNGNANKNGEEIKIEYEFIVANVANKNTYSLTLSYLDEQGNTHSVQTVKHQAGTNDYHKTGSIHFKGRKFSKDFSWKFKAVLTDHFSTDEASREVKGLDDIPIHFSGDGKSVAILTSSSAHGEFECGAPFVLQNTRSYPNVDRFYYNSNNGQTPLSVGEFVTQTWDRFVVNGRNPVGVLAQFPSSWSPTGKDVWLDGYLVYINDPASDNNNYAVGIFQNLTGHVWVMRIMNIKLLMNVIHEVGIVSQIPYDKAYVSWVDVGLQAYPKDSVYQSTIRNNPSLKFGGQWKLIDKRTASESKETIYSWKRTD